jgi:hypothetical protein
MSDEELLARARRSVAAKQERGVYPPALLDALAEPLDLRPEPEVAGGVAWPEAVRTASVTVARPAPSTRPVFGALLTALKRGVERGLRWYLPPVAEQVSRHNRAVIEVLAEHNREIVELHRELEALRRRVADLETRGKDGPTPRS